MRPTHHEPRSLQIRASIDQFGRTLTAEMRVIITLTIIPGTAVPRSTNILNATWVLRDYFGPDQNKTILYEVLHACFADWTRTQTSAYLVVVDDHALQLHAHLHDGREVLDAVERDLRDVKQPRHSADLHERSVGLDGLDVTATAPVKEINPPRGKISTCSRKIRNRHLRQGFPSRLPHSSCYHTAVVAIEKNTETLQRRHAFKFESPRRFYSCTGQVCLLCLSQYIQHVYARYSIRK